MASWTHSLFCVTDSMVWTGSHFSFFITGHIVWTGSDLSPHGVNRFTSQLLSQETTHYGANRFTSQFRPHGVNRFRPQPHGVNRSTSQLLSQETTHYGVNRSTSQLRHQGVNRFTFQLTSRCEPFQIPASLCRISRRKAVHILTTVWTGSHLSFCLRDHTLRCEPVQIPASLCETSRCEPVSIPAPLSRFEPVHISDSDPSTSHTGLLNTKMTSEFRDDIVESQRTWYGAYKVTSTSSAPAIF